MVGIVSRGPISCGNFARGDYLVRVIVVVISALCCNISLQRVRAKLASTPMLVPLTAGSWKELVNVEIL